MSWKISSYRTMRIDIKRRCNTFESVAASSEFFTEVMTALLARVERVSSSPVYVNSHCAILKEQNFHDRSGIRHVSIATWHGKLDDSTAHKFVEYRKKRNSWINQLSRNYATFFEKNHLISSNRIRKLARSSSGPFKVEMVYLWKIQTSHLKENVIVLGSKKYKHKAFIKA